MTDLTEQWKKGELPEGWYYVKVNDKLANNPVITECVSDYNLSGKFIPDFYEYDDDKIIEVLAPVPSYEEWKAKLEENARLKERVSKLEKMQYSYTPEEWNTMLRTVNRTKELLKEIRDSIAKSQLKLTPEGFKLITEIVTKIDEALR